MKIAALPSRLAPARLRRTARSCLAVCFQGDALQFARGAHGNGSAVAATDVIAPVPGPAPAEGQPPPPVEWPALAQSLRARVDPRECRVVMAAAAGDVVCRSVELPTAAPGEVRQMLDLQIDQLTPLPLDEVVYGFEPLETRDGRTRVLLAIARKQPVNERVGILEAAGLPPELVAVDILVLYRALRRQDRVPADDALHMLVGVEAGALQVVLHCQGQPVLVRSIPFAPGALDEPAGRGELCDELRRTRLAIELEQPGRTAGTTLFVPLLPELQSRVAALAGETDPAAHCLAATEVPPLSASLCQEAAATAPTLNLLPQEWRDRRRRARVRRGLVRAGIGLGAIYVAVLSGFLVTQAWRKARLSHLRGQVRQLEPAYRQARQLQSELTAMQRQLDSTYSALEVLREVSVQMPDSIKLSNFNFRRDDTLSLRGQADAAPAVYDFIGRLEKCPLFASVKTETVRTEGAAGLTKFELLATLKPAAAKAQGAAWH